MAQLQTFSWRRSLILPKYDHAESLGRCNLFPASQPAATHLPRSPTLDLCLLANPPSRLPQANIPLLPRCCPLEIEPSSSSGSTMARPTQVRVPRSIAPTDLGIWANWNAIVQASALRFQMPPTSRTSMPGRSIPELPLTMPSTAPKPPPGSPSRARIPSWKRTHGDTRSSRA
jgi:hypothetical protein